MHRTFPCESGRCRRGASASVAAAVAVGAVFALGLFLSSPARACTTFYFEQDGATFGKSYDWSTSVGRVLVNKRGLVKQALTISGDDTPAAWTALYGSVTFNQYGRELPNGGMNEVGLVVEIMWLNESVYPPMDARPVVNEMQWIQYALDNFATVDELVVAAPGLRVSPIYAEVHYLACDTDGVCAAFEYLGGQLVITRGADLVTRTLTNDTYPESSTFLAEHEGFGGSTPIPTDSGSLSRFVRAAALAGQVAPGTSPEAPDSAFEILDSVSQGDYSVWQIVYRPHAQRVYWRTDDVPTIKWVDLGAFDLDCQAPVMLLDIDDPGTGDVSALFEEYTSEANAALIEISYGELGGSLPPGAMLLATYYPDAHTCTEVPDPDPDPEPDDGVSDGGGCAVSSTGGDGPWGALLLAMLLLFARRRPWR